MIQTTEVHFNVLPASSSEQLLSECRRQPNSDQDCCTEQGRIPAVFPVHSLDAVGEEPLALLEASKCPECLHLLAPHREDHAPTHGRQAVSEAKNSTGEKAGILPPPMQLSCSKLGPATHLLARCPWEELAATR